MTPLSTANFVWRKLDLHLLDGDDPVRSLQTLLQKSCIEGRGLPP
uniref:Uncharacterized protein n=1 Tax=Rhizobium rhizogenes TaxID=359 RepID=A0A7S5DQL4_RHIRH|nr:hypothetical protein pC5.7b_426 [Rhizobium rhizogenes]